MRVQFRPVSAINLNVRARTLTRAMGSQAIAITAGRLTEKRQRAIGRRCKRAQHEERMLR